MKKEALHGRYFEIEDSIYFVIYEKETDMLICGTATNAGVIRMVEMEYDNDLSPYGNLFELYNMVHDYHFENN